MPRRIPDCAFCGEPLKNTGHVRTTYKAIPGNPEIGWHYPDCAEKDDVFQNMRKDIKPEKRITPKAALKEIAKRGKSRISANKGFWDVKTG